MVRLMQQTNGQYIITVPKPVVNALGAEKGDKLEFDIDLRKREIKLRVAE